MVIRYREHPNGRLRDRRQGGSAVEGLGSAWYIIVAGQAIRRLPTAPSAATTLPVAVTVRSSQTVCDGRALPMR